MTNLKKIDYEEQLEELSVRAVKKENSVRAVNKGNLMKGQSFDTDDSEENSGIVTIVVRDNMRSVLEDKIEDEKYQIGQKVFYPSQGVCEIIGIEYKQIGKLIKFYVLSVKGVDCKIMVPVEGVDKVGLRSIIDEDRALNLFNLMAKKLGRSCSKVWSIRHNVFLQKLKKGVPEEMVEIYRESYWLIKTSHKISFAEIQMYGTVRRIICTEIALALNLSEVEVLKKMEEIMYRSL